MAMFNVIKYNGDGDTLVYRFPEEDFNTKSQLIVQQSQEAIFYYRGAMADHFTEPGHYTLNTQNIPVLCHLVNLPFGKESPFTATVYFIDKTERPNNLFGIGHIPFLAKDFGNMPLDIGLSGQYFYKINDSKLFIEKVLGTVKQYSNLEATALVENIMTNKLTSYMTKYMNESQFDLLTLETEIDSLSQRLKLEMMNEFYAYGFELTNLIVTSISKHEENSNYQRYLALRTQKAQLMEIQLGKELISEKKSAEIEISKIEEQGKIAIEQMQREAQAQMAYYTAAQKRTEGQADIDLEAARIKAIGEAEAARIKATGEAEAAAKAAMLGVTGLTGEQELGYQVAMETAKNPGVGNMASTGMGLGVMAGSVGPAQQFVGGIYSDALSGINRDAGTQRKVTEKAMETLPAGDALSMAGIGNVGLGVNIPEQANNPSYSDFQKPSRNERLAELKEQYESGLIPEDMYRERVQQILSEI